MTLRDDIKQAIKEAGIEGFSFIRLTKWESVLQTIAEHFLTRGVRSLELVWMWEEFRGEISSFQPPEEQARDYLREQLEPAAVYWFLASEEDGKYWVAEATGESIVQVIGDMYCFEYYVVDRCLQWILCENHHSVFIKASVPETMSGE